MILSQALSQHFLNKDRRLNSDRILVLDNGEVIEFDNPKTLLANKNSMFYEFYNNANQKDN